jgi:hypothetical protein
VIADGPPDRARVLSSFEKSDVLHPRDANDETEAAVRRLIKQTHRWRRVRAHRVRIQCGNRSEVLRDATLIGKLRSICIGRKRTVADAFYQKAPAVNAQELAGDAYRPLDRDKT